MFPPSDVQTIFCDDCEAGYRVPWTRSEVDLDGLGGQRIVIRATPSDYTSCAPDVYETLVLDDFRVE